MAELSTHPVLERKIRSAAGGSARIGGADVWRRILPRVAEEGLGLELAVLSVEEGETSLTRTLADLQADLLLLGLARNGAVCGLAILDTALLGALMEVQTTGRVSSSRREKRAGTSTDFALVSHVIDGWLAAVAEMLPGGGVAPCCARLFPDARAVRLGLDDGAFRETRLELEFGGGRRTGVLRILAPRDDNRRARGLDLSDLRAALLPLPARIDAVLCRVNLPLSRVMALEVGELLDLEGASVRRIKLEAPLGHPVSRAHLGQSRGQRAVRILRPAEADGPEGRLAQAMSPQIDRMEFDGEAPPGLRELDAPADAPGLPPLPDAGG